VLRLVGAIPARLGSTRIPRKVLLRIDGRPLLWWVWQNVITAGVFADVAIVTDSHEVRQEAGSWGARVIMSPNDLDCGTSRLGSVIDQLTGDCVVNVQADMPWIDRELLEAVAATWSEHQSSVITPVFQIRDVHRLFDPNLVKVVIGGDGNALYFSRQPIPFLRDCPSERWPEQHTYLGHVGIYAYGPQLIRHFASMPSTPLERAERLEQLRFLANGIPVRTFLTSCPPVSIDSVGDLERVGSADIVNAEPSDDRLKLGPA